MPRCGRRGRERCITAGDREGSPAGRAKTRLCPPCAPEQAAALAEAALRDTLEVVFATPAARRVLVLDGDPTRWRGRGWRSIAQRGDGLAQRLGNAFADVGGPGAAGRDGHAAADRASCWPTGCGAARFDAVLGPAHDGGYWSVGLQRPHATRVPRCPDELRRRRCARQRERFAALGLTTYEQPCAARRGHDRRRAGGRPPGARLAVRRRAGGDRVTPAAGSSTPTACAAAPGTSWWSGFADGTAASAAADALDWRSPTRSTSGRCSALRGPVLDVGCGPGRHLHALARRGVFGLGVDLSPVGGRAGARRRRAARSSARSSTSCPGPVTGAARCCWTATSGSAAIPRGCCDGSAGCWRLRGAALVELRAARARQRPHADPAGGPGADERLVRLGRGVGHRRRRGRRRGRTSGRALLVRERALVRAALRAGVASGRDRGEPARTSAGRPPSRVTSRRALSERNASIGWPASSISRASARLGQPACRSAATG